MSFLILGKSAGRLAVAYWQAWRTRLSGFLAPGQSGLTLRRFRHYFFGVTFLAAVFCALRGRGLSASEQRRMVRMSALAAFFDDLAEGAWVVQDKGGIARRPSADYPTPESFGQAVDSEGFAIRLLGQIRSDLPEENKAAFEACLQRVFEVETAEPELPYPLESKALEDRTAEKGGCSVLLFRCLLEEPLMEAERNALFAFGALMQWTDDIYDVWFDRRAAHGGITPAVFFLEKNAVAALQAGFEEKVAAVKAAFHVLVTQHFFPEKNADAALGLIEFVSAVARVALQHYQKLLEKHGTLPLDNRALMVVDMGRWANRFRAIRFLLQN